MEVTDYIALLPLELREKIYRYVIWASAKPWKNELVLTWAKHRALHGYQRSVQNSNKQEIFNMILYASDLVSRQDLSHTVYLAAQRKLNAVINHGSYALSELWVFSFVDASLGDAYRLCAQFEDSPQYLMFRLYAQKKYSFVPDDAFNTFYILGIKGCIIFTQPVSMVRVLELLGIKATVQPKTSINVDECLEVDGSFIEVTSGPEPPEWA